MTDPTSNLLTRPCIQVSPYVEAMTVAQYDAVMSPRNQVRHDKGVDSSMQPIWAIHARPVYELMADGGTRILDKDAYHAQMVHLLGLD